MPVLLVLLPIFFIFCSLPSRRLLVEIQQWKTLKQYVNMFKLNNALALLLTLNRVNIRSKLFKKMEVSTPC